jgi:hypothetical protein
MSLRWPGAVLGLAVLLSATAPSAQTVRRALVIAHNASDDPAMPPLRYADDDGVRWAEVLERLGVETHLLVDADEETRQLGSVVLNEARPPTLEELSRTVARLRTAIRADSAAGRQTDLLLVYVGHGNTDDAGRAYLTVLGGRLDQTAFYERLVDPLGADFVHVLVDACRASGVVGRRGTDAAVLKELRAVLGQEQLAARPSVGALFAESDSGETHEWSRIRSGVFSHVVRSGLLGGADVNGDGAVEYSELAAFVAASLQEVKALPARLFVRAFPPALEPRRPLVALAPPGPSLPLPADLPHTRLSVEDEEGLRLVDVRRAEGQSLELRLPLRDVYWVRTPEGEAPIALAQLGAKFPAMKPREMQERGPVEDALRRGLFAMPLDRDFYEQYVAQTRLVPVDFSRPLAPLDSPPLPDGRLGLSFGAVMQRAPLALREFSTGPSVAWRSRPAPYTYGLRAVYALSPATSQEIFTQRLSLQGVVGLEGQGRLAPFFELAAGWSLVSVRRTEGSWEDPTVFSGHLSTGMMIPVHDLFRLRVSAHLGADLLTFQPQNRWDAMWGLELALQR